MNYFNEGGEFAICILSDVRYFCRKEWKTFLVRKVTFCTLSGHELSQQGGELAIFQSSRVKYFRCEEQKRNFECAKSGFAH